MPIFEYSCKACEHEFEELVIRRDETIACPECGSEDTTKLLSGFAVGGSARKAPAGGCGSCKPSAGKCAGCG